MLYDGRLLWSDLDATTTGALVDFVLMQDRGAVHNKAVAIMQQQGESGFVSHCLFFYALFSTYKQYTPPFITTLLTYQCVLHAHCIISY